MRSIARELMGPYSTVRDWLIRMAHRGLGGRFDRKSTGRKRILGPNILKKITKWTHMDPSKYGFESASWSLDMVNEMIQRKVGRHARPRTLRRILRRLGLSCSKPRPVPRKTAPAEEQETFTERTKRMILGVSGHGYAVFAVDEAGILRGMSPEYGWRPVRGGNTVNTACSTKSSRIFGALSSDRIHVKDIEFTNSETFKDFLTGMRQIYGKFVMIPDNAPYHKTDTVMDFVNGTKGDIRLIFLPPYTPQLNPIEVQWRVIKKMLAGRQFKTPDEVAGIVKKMIETGEMRPVKLMKYLTQYGFLREFLRQDHLSCSLGMISDEWQRLRPVPTGK